MGWSLRRLKEGDLMKKIEAARDEVCTSSTPCCALFLCMRVEGCSLHCMHDVLL